MGKLRPRKGWPRLSGAARRPLHGRQRPSPSLLPPTSPGRRREGRRACLSVGPQGAARRFSHLPGVRHRLPAGAGGEAHPACASLCAAASPACRLSVSLGLPFLLCLSVCVSVCVRLSVPVPVSLSPLFSVGVFPFRSPLSLLLSVTFSLRTILFPSLGPSASFSISVFSQLLLSGVSLSMSIFLRTLLFFLSLPAISFSVSLSLSDSPSPHCLSLLLLCLFVTRSLLQSLHSVSQKLCISETLHLCASLVIAPGSPHHPQVRATDSPNPSVKGHPPEDRCGLARATVPYWPHQTVPCVCTCVCRTQILVNKYGHRPPSCVPPALCSGTWPRLGPFSRHSCFSQRAAKTGYLVPDVGSGKGLGVQNSGAEGAGGLDSWVPEEGGDLCEIHDYCQGLQLGRIYYH